MGFFPIDLVSHAGTAKHSHFEDIPEKMKVTLLIGVTQIVTNRNMLLYWQRFN